MSDAQLKDVSQVTWDAREATEGKWGKMVMEVRLLLEATVN